LAAARGRLVARQVAAIGGYPVIFPAIVILPPDDRTALDRHGDQIDSEEAERIEHPGRDLPVHLVHQDGLGHLVRELRVDRIWEGTSEIQRLIVGSQLRKRGPRLFTDWPGGAARDGAP
jgi:alkylation response protein AidB-like acyl-CoA dehydrogenase